MKKLMMGKVNGFTLIEMLIVTAMIAILAAMLFPALQRARAKAREIKCQSNLKQIGVAMMLYARDWDGWLPSHLNPEPWARVLHMGGYTGAVGQPGAGVDVSRNIFVCPDFHPHTFNEGVWWMSYHWTYGMTVTWTLGPGGGVTPNNTHKRVDRPGWWHQTAPMMVPLRRDPSNFPLIVDSIAIAAPPARPIQITHVGVVPVGIAGASFTAHPTRRAHHTRHDGRFNVLHVDGHVASYNRDEFLGTFRLAATSLHP